MNTLIMIMAAVLLTGTIMLLINLRAILFKKSQSIQDEDEDFKIPPNVMILEHEHGKFQVWIDDKVLRPDCYVLEEECQQYHEFMFFDDIKQARRDIVYFFKKTKVVFVHEF